jgi:hypothetical protein
MDLSKIIADLREQRDRVQEAIAVGFERAPHFAG